MIFNSYVSLPEGMVNGPSSLMIDLRDTVMLDGYAKNYQRVDFSAGPSAQIAQ